MSETAAEAVAPEAAEAPAGLSEEAASVVESIHQRRRQFAGGERPTASREERIAAIRARTAGETPAEPAAEAVRPDASAPESPDTEGPETQAGGDAEPEEIPEPEFRKKIRALNRKGKQNREAIAKLEADRAAFDAERQTFARERESLAATRAKLKTDPLAVLEEWGVPLDDIALRALNPEKKQALDDESKARIAKLEADLKSAQEASQAQAIERERARVSRELVAASDKFAYAKAAVDDIAAAGIQVMEAHYEETQEILTPEQALGVVDDHFKALAKRFGASGPPGGEPAPEQQAPADGPQKPATRKKASTKSLTNASQETSGAKSTSRKAYTSRRARMKAALKSVEKRRAQS